MANFVQHVMVFLSTFMVTASSLYIQNYFQDGSLALPVELHSFETSPSSIQIPGATSIHVDSEVHEEVGTSQKPLHVRVTLERIVRIGFGWFSYLHPVSVPCMDLGDGIFVGSCDYADICTAIDLIHNETNGDQCAEAEAYGFPCSCPIPIARYATYDAPIMLQSSEGIDTGEMSSTTALLLEGQYHGIIEIRTSLEDTDFTYDGLLGCFELSFNIGMETLASGLTGITIS